MNNNTVEQPSNNRWLLPVLLVLLILIILAGAFFATHRNLFASKATPTPTPHVITATPLPRTATPKAVTATPKPGPTGTPKPGPTATTGSGGTSGHPTPTSRPATTSRPAPTSTPRPTPKPSPTALNGVHAGTFTYTQAQVNTIQQGANRGESAYTFYTDPFRVVQGTLPHYNFKPGFTISAPPTPPAATPTASTSANGQPSVVITVSYRGATYHITLIQPVQHGPKGIWVIYQIRVG